MAMRFWEDLEVGRPIEFGDKLVTRDEIVAFGLKYDPQPMHCDPAAAGRGAHGDVIASGWQVGGFAMRLLADGVLRDVASAGAPGVEKLRWLRPVLPGDRLRLRSTIQEKYPSRSRPTLGFVRNAHELVNQRGEVVMTMAGIGMVLRRAADQAGGA